MRLSVSHPGEAPCVDNKLWVVPVFVCVHDDERQPCGTPLAVGFNRLTV